MTKTIRIGIDGSIFSEQPRGHSLYTYRLCEQLGAQLPEAQFFVYSPWPVDLSGFKGDWTLQTGSKRSRLSPVLWLKTVAGKMCQADRLDLFWSPYVFLPRLGRETKTLITVYDFVNQITPDSFARLHSLAYTLFARSDIRQADTIVTISQGTNDKLLQYFGRRSLVVKPALEPRYRRPDSSEIQATLNALNIRQPYLLNVATWDPRKNVATLVRAFLEMKTAGEIPHQLILVGKKDRAVEEIQHLIANQEQQNIIALGYLDDQYLPSLYAGADAFVFPSIYEGFGMPVLEARACGTQVVTTDIPELREAGDDNCIYVQPTESGIRQGILCALSRNGRDDPGPSAPSWSDQAGLLAAEMRRLIGAQNSYT